MVTGIAPPYDESGGLRRALSILSKILIILGIVVVAAWHTHQTWIIQIKGAFAPMQHNTALLFLVLGLGLHFYVQEKRKIAVAFGTIALLFGAAIGVQYAFDVDLGIDRLFIAPYISIHVSHPGRPSPITAGAFFLAGLALALCRLRLCVFSFTFFGLATTGLGFMAVMTYVVGLGGIIEWVEFNRVAINTAVGLCLLGVALLICARLEFSRNDNGTAVEERLPFNASIQTSLMFYIMSLLAVSGGILSLTGYFFAREILVQQIHTRLNSLAEDRKRILSASVEYEKERIALVTSRTRLRQLVQQRVAGTLPAAAFQSEAGPILLDVIRSVPNFNRISIIDATGADLLTTDGLPNPPEFAKLPDVVAGWDNTHFGAIHRKDIQSRVILSAPILPSDGKAVAVLVIQADAATLSNWIVSTEGLGRTGEVLVGLRENSKIRMLVQPRNDLDADLLEPERAPGLDAALKGQNGFMRLHDYRGVVALSAYRHVPELKWALVVKMDLEEAYAPVGRLQWMLTLLLLGFISVGALLAYLLSAHFGRPLRNLLVLVNRIASGKFDARFNEVRSDEIGQLGAALDGMAGQLAELYGRQQREITERTKAERELRVIRDRLVAALESSEMGTWTWFVDTNKAFWDEGMCKLFGRTREEMQPDDSIENTQRTVHPEDHKTLNDGMQRSIQTKSLLDVEFRTVHPVTGRVRHIAARGLPEIDADGRVVSFSGACIDITERKEAMRQVNEQAVLRASEERFRMLLETAPNAMILVDQRGKIELVNAQTEKLFGYKRDEMIGQPVENLVPNRFRAAHPGHRASYHAMPTTRAMGAGRELYGLRKDGTETPIDIGLTPVPTANGMSVLASIFDITDRKKAEGQVKQSLREKEALLKEIHHRVKNNLQIVASLLNMSAAKATSASDRAILEDSQARVYAMALVHQKLYQSLDLARIDFGDYLNGLLVDMMQSTGASSDIVLDVHVSEVWLDVDTAVPCGLIVNELVTNAVKYAFPKDGSVPNPKLTVRLSSEAGNRARLIISDNGRGLPANFKPGEGTSLGMKLVTALTQQINGKLEINGPPGATFKIDFPLPAEKTSDESSL